jgi:hypothetical protein
LFIPYFPICGDIRTDNPTAGKKRFGDGQAEAFNCGRRDNGLALPVAPLQLRLRYAFKKSHAGLKSQRGYKAMYIARLRSCDPDDDQLHFLFDLAHPQYTVECPNEQREVLVAAVLRDTEKELIILPIRYGWVRI